MNPIEPFIHRKVIVLRQDTSIRDVALAMKERRVGCVVVADGRGHVVGIATDRDLVVRGYSASVPEDAPISEVCSRAPVLAGEGATLTEVTRIMEERGVRRVPVVHALSDGRQRCVGLVTLDDLIAAGAIELRQLGRIVRAQVARRYRAAGWLESIDLRSVSGERDRFHEEIRRRLGPKLEFSLGETEQLARLVLGALVRRLHQTGAMHLIHQLPRLLQRELLDLPPGPDSSITAMTLLSEISRIFNVDDATAYLVLTRFCAAVEELLDEREVEQVKAQLPTGLRRFFEARKAA